MLKGHLTRVMYHQEYNGYEDKYERGSAGPLARSVERYTSLWPLIGWERWARGSDARREDVEGSPTQSRISPSIQDKYVYYQVFNV